MGVEIVEVEGAVLRVNMGHPVATDGDCGIFILCREGWRCSCSETNLGFLL